MKNNILYFDGDTRNYRRRVSKNKKGKVGSAQFKKSGYIIR